MTAFLNAYSTHFWWGVGASGPGLIPKCSLMGDNSQPRLFRTLVFPPAPHFFRFKPHGLCLLFACQKDSVIMLLGYSGKALRLRGM